MLLLLEVRKFFAPVFIFVTRAAEIKSVYKLLFFEISQNYI